MARRAPLACAATWHDEAGAGIVTAYVSACASAQAAQNLAYQQHGKHRHQSGGASWRIK